MSSSALKNLKFEVFGRVQGKRMQTIVLTAKVIFFTCFDACSSGVFFRKHTTKKAEALKLVGWVRNTPRGTVEGVAQGQTSGIEEFKHFLQYEGSPQSKIEKTTFSDEKDISELEFEKFEVRK